MFRALVIKDWMQLRALRWAGFGLGLGLPLLLLAGAEAGRQGWLPGKIAGYNATTILIELAPAFFVALWALLVLLVTAQSFVGERAAGTETFLLERPVPRARIWQSRLLASLATILVLLAGHLVYWAALTQIAVSPSQTHWSSALTILSYGAGGAFVAGFFGGIAASALVNSPMQAVLLGILFGGLPAGIAALMTALFPFAMYRRVPLAAIIPWILLAAYVVLSFRVSCRGEPAGRGRYKRGLATLGIALAVIPVLFFASAPLAMRKEAARLPRGGVVMASGSGDRALVLGGELQAGWILDVENKRRLRFLPPPVSTARWSPEGDRLALVHHAGLSGRFAGLRVDILDASGARLKRFEIDEPMQDLSPYFSWAGEHLVTRTYDSAGEMLVLDLATGATREVAIDAPWRSWRLLGSNTGGRLWIVRAATPDRPGPAEFRPFDVATGEIGPVAFEDPRLEEIDARQHYGYFNRMQLSPSGRYVLLGAAGLGIVDLEGGTRIDTGPLKKAKWLAGDRLAYLEQDALVVREVGGETREIRSFPDRFVAFSVSPDAGRVLVSTSEYGTAGEPGTTCIAMEGSHRVDLAPRTARVAVWDAAQDRWFDKSESLGQELECVDRVWWASTETLAVSGEGYLMLQDVEGDSAPTTVVGDAG